MSRAWILGLKTLIVALFAAVLFLQAVLVPRVVWEVVENEPEMTPLQWPLLIAALLFLVCVEVVLVSVWRLLSMVAADALFRIAAFAWVDAIIWSIVVATASLAFSGALAVALALMTPLGLVLAVVGVLVGAGLSLIVVVMRGLLVKAARLEQEMAEVV